MMVLKPAEIKFCSRRESRHLQQKPSRRPPIFQRDVVVIFSEKEPEKFDFRPRRRGIFVVVWLHFIYDVFDFLTNIVVLEVFEQ